MSGTVPIRLPDETVAELRSVAMLKRTTPGALLAEAWAQWSGRPQAIFCWQCGHLEENHTVEDHGCTVPSCSCAQVPES